ncbi:MAG TPA: hypothetical protein VFJ05_05845 [Nitrososphaeraceae archaeon]|nr:hypothetical protein [Nitrososphaeraceae archaeon]
MMCIIKQTMYIMLPAKVSSAFDELNEAENKKIQQIHDKYEQDMQKMREDMHQNFSQIISLMNQNPQLARLNQRFYQIK